MAQLQGKTCPICRKQADAACYPFCSPRCADVDLGRWLNEAYTIPTQEVPEPDDENGRQ